MDTLFTKIIKGEIPCYKVAENDRFFAFLDINQFAKGHTLVIPKQEGDYIFDLDEETYIAYLLYARNIAIAIEKAIPCKRIATAVIGLEVPHTHIHLVPIQTENDMNFGQNNKQESAEEMDRIASAIRKELSCD
ncbi:MAG: HIT family protein [Bacteroidaceae bacterium]